MSKELPLSKYEKKGFVVFNHFGFAPLTFLEHSYEALKRVVRAELKGHSCSRFRPDSDPPTLLSRESDSLSELPLSSVDPMEVVLCPNRLGEVSSEVREGLDAVLLPLEEFDSLL
jgi:hypothetical protein